MFYKSMSVPKTALSDCLETADTTDQTVSLMSLHTRELYSYKYCLWITTSKSPGVRWGNEQKKNYWTPQKEQKKNYWTPQKMPH